MSSFELSVTLPQGYSFLGFEELGSTSDHARAIASEWFEKEPINEALWIWTARQTAGRGRRGREWLSQKGNFTATLLFRPGCTLGQAGQLSFVAALAVADVLEAFVDPEDVTLKWPNDILLGGQKASGILLETSGSSDGTMAWLSVGIGINLAFHPDDTPYPAESLAHFLGLPAGAAGPDPILVLELVAASFDDWYAKWLGKGFEPIREVWLDRAERLGQAIEIKLGAETLTGVFETLDREGSLVLSVEDGSKRHISAGEINFHAPNQRG